MSRSSVVRSYGKAIRDAHEYLLKRHPEVFVLGQGLWSPWYVGDSMTELEMQFGKDRIIDTPVSEQSCTGAAIGAALTGKRPIVVHPRMDFLILAVDQIVTQAAKWSSMFGGRARVPVVVRGIINRGGEQGAQHSQALHAWFAHVPGLKVVMPATVEDARDLLVSATLSDDPVVYIDDRWLYDEETEIPVDPDENALHRGSVVRRHGTDATLVAAGHLVKLSLEAAEVLAEEGVEVEVIDLRVINPLDVGPVVESVKKTGALIAADGGWTACGLAGEIIAATVESLSPGSLVAAPRRVTLQDAPAPTSGPLEAKYYPDPLDISSAIRTTLDSVAIRGD